MNQSKLSQIIALSLGVLSMVLFVSMVVLAWTEPSQTPPGGNVPAPINVGGTAQTKEGAIGANGGFFVDGYEMVGANADMLYANRRNTTGGGMWLSDDGGFYDYNNGYVDFRGSTGIRVLEANGTWGDNSIRASYLCIQDNCINSWAQAGGYWTQSGSNLYPNNTGWNVGIGTTDPGGYRLRVNGSIRGTQVYTDDWFRTFGGTGLYSQDYDIHFYPEGSTYWRIHNTNGLHFYTWGWGNAGWLYHDGGTNIGLLPPDGNWQIRAWNAGVELYDTTYVNTEYGYIWYDRNDSGYYVDPNSTSRVYNLESLNVVKATQWVGAGCEAGVWCESSGGYSIMYPSGAIVSTGYVQSPLFYDYNDSWYQVDPTGYTRINRLNVSRDRVEQCCGNDATISIGEATSTTGRRASISFHNGGVAEGTFELASSGWRRMRLYDNQGQAMGLETTGPIWVKGVITGGMVGTWPYETITAGWQGSPSWQLRLMSAGPSMYFYTDITGDAGGVNRARGRFTYNDFYIRGSYYCNQGMDVAEYIGVGRNSNPNIPGAGDVIVIDTNDSEKVILSTRKYDSTVAGVVSTNPGLTLAASFDENEAETVRIGNVRLALAGRTPVKVTTENGPVKPGDLLVTSSKPGYAMKGDIEKIKEMPGVVLGKAMESLEQGEGEIVVLIMLR